MTPQEPIVDWKKAAVEMYFRQNGHRCVVCSGLVAVEDAKLWKFGEDFLLTHEGCE